MNDKLSSFHKRNSHQGFYDFEKLIKVQPDLKKFVKKNAYGNESIDFSNPMAVLCLNQALLKKDYNLDWDLPKGFLCPPIPSRADYIHHLADLLSSKCSSNGKIKILDIGTGANCIYPLIGASVYHWDFIGSDINQKALEHAQTLIEKNHLDSRIKLRFQPSKDHIYQNILDPHEAIEASMCNPPFHTSLAHAKKGTQRKWKNLKIKTNVLNFGGTSDELFCAGGEVAFIKKMIKESPSFNIKWHTTLVSKESFLAPIYKALQDIKCHNVQTIPMGHGQKKSRIVAWSLIT